MIRADDDRAAVDERADESLAADRIEQDATRRFGSARDRHAETFPGVAAIGGQVKSLIARVYDEVARARIEHDAAQVERPRFLGGDQRGGNGTPILRGRLPGDDGEQQSRDDTANVFSDFI